VISASRTIAWMGIPVGATLGGVLGDAIGLRPLFVGGGGVIVAVSLLMMIGPLGKPDDATPGPGAGFSPRGETGGTEI